MFGIGGFELFLILLFGFLVLGPDKLPEMAKTAGKAINKFRNAREEMDKVIKTEVVDPVTQGVADVKEEVSSSEKKKEPKKTVRVESYSERRANYEKERAEKKALEIAQSAQGAPAVAVAAAEASKPSAAELYGTPKANAATEEAAAARIAASAVKTTESDEMEKES